MFRDAACRRLLRWCCVLCCCRGSCDLKRSKHDAGELLFGQRMKVNKVGKALTERQMSCAALPAILSASWGVWL